MGYTWQYYDLVLLGIGASVATGVGVAFLTPVAPATAIITACLFAVVLIGHGLFVNGPVDEVTDLGDEVDVLN